MNIMKDKDTIAKEIAEINKTSSDYKEGWARTIDYVFNEITQAQDQARREVFSIVYDYYISKPSPNTIKDDKQRFKQYEVLNIIHLLEGKTGIDALSLLHREDKE